MYTWFGEDVDDQVWSDLMSGSGSLKQVLNLRNVNGRAFALGRWILRNPAGIAKVGTLIDECPDPANHDFTLKLYSLKEIDGINFLVMTNASPNHGGGFETFIEGVPVDCKTALSAVAWKFDISAEEYQTLEVAG